MSRSIPLDAYVRALIAGDRRTARRCVAGLLAAGSDATTIYHELLWPAMEAIEQLFSADRINTAAEHMATRINRHLADQLQAHLPQAAAMGRRVLITCADAEPEELGAQMCADLFESVGWTVHFLGGGVPADEILALVGQLQPDLLLIFGTQPSGVPGVRRLVELIRDVGVYPAMNIMVSGGVFNRAEGLWKEVGVDLFCRSAKDALPLAMAAGPRTAGAVRPAEPQRKRRRRRRPAETVAGAA